MKHLVTKSTCSNSALTNLMNLEQFTYGFMFGYAMTFGLTNFIAWVKKSRKLAKAKATRDANKKAEILKKLGY